MSITPNLMSDLLGRLPNFELSYETISHKKVSTDYNITLAVPYGKKAYIWFTFLRDKDVCLLLEIGREKKITSMKLLSDVNIPRHLAYGTILYGSVCETPDVGQCFVFEDIFYSKGVSIVKQPFGEKLGFLYELFTYFPDCFSQNKSLPIVMPVCWPLIVDSNSNVPDHIQSQIPYTVHHIQHRALHVIVPYINIPFTRNILSSTKPTVNTTSPLLFIPPNLPRFDYSKMQYKQPTTFEIKADLQNDIYHLYAFGKGSDRVYCGIAYIPSYKTSQFMNAIFRNIKENRNLDALEESDDEEDFQNMRDDKYVDLQKTISIECTYMPKFRRWVPTKQVNGRGQIVNVRQL